MSKICLEIEFLAGTPLQHAVEQAKYLAKFLNLAYVKLDFNGTRFSIGRNADIKSVVDEYHLKTSNHIVKS